MLCSCRGIVGRSIHINRPAMGRTRTHRELISLFSSNIFARVSTFTGSTGNSIRTITKFKAINNTPICTFSRGINMGNNTIDITRYSGVGGVCSLTGGAKYPIINVCSSGNVDLGRNFRNLSTCNRVLGTSTYISNMIPRVSVITNSTLNAATLITGVTSVIITIGSTSFCLATPSRIATRSYTRRNAISVITSSVTSTVSDMEGVVAVLPSGGLDNTPVFSFRSSTITISANTSTESVIFTATSSNDIVRLGDMCTSGTMATVNSMVNTAAKFITFSNTGLYPTYTCGTRTFIGFYSTFGVPVMAFIGTSNVVGRGRGRVLITTAGLAATCTSTAYPGLSIVANRTINTTCVTLTNENSGTSLICT